MWISFDLFEICECLINSVSSFYSPYSLFLSLIVSLLIVIQNRWALASIVIVITVVTVVKLQEREVSFHNWDEYKLRMTIFFMKRQRLLLKRESSWENAFSSTQHRIFKLHLERLSQATDHARLLFLNKQTNETKFASKTDHRPTTLQKRNET